MRHLPDGQKAISQAALIKASVITTSGYAQTARGEVMERRRDIERKEIPVQPRH